MDWWSRKPRSLPSGMRPRARVEATMLLLVTLITSGITLSIVSFLPGR